MNTSNQGVVPPNIDPSLSEPYSHLFQEVKSPLAGTFFFSRQEIPGEIPISCGFHCSNSQIEGETQASLYAVFLYSRLTTVMEVDFISLASVTVGMEHDGYTQALRSCLDENSVVSIFNGQSNRASLNQSCHRTRKAVVEPA